MKSFSKKTYIDRSTRIPMSCKGCGSEEKLFQACKSPNNAELRTRCLQEIANEKAHKRQERYLASFYFQIEDAAESRVNSEPDPRHSAIAN